MKKLSLIAFIAIAAFLSFGFVLLKDSTKQEVQLEEIEITKSTNELEPIQDSNEDIW